MGIKILIVVTFHRFLDRTEIVKKFIDDFNNSLYLPMKTSKNVSKFSLASHIQKKVTIKESSNNYNIIFRF